MSTKITNSISLYIRDLKHYFKGFGHKTQHTPLHLYLSDTAIFQRI